MMSSVTDAHLLRFEIRRMHCRRCDAVKRESLAFLADNPFYTKRFAYYVGRRCQSSSIKEIAEELQLDWDSVKELEKQYMRAQLKRADTRTAASRAWMSSTVFSGKRRPKLSVWP
jgi:transposase